MYGGYISDEGTLELWIKVNHGYRYDNFQFLDNLDEAVIFSSDCVGGDVTWPGTTKLTVKGNGDITLWMATSKYNQAPAQATVATGTLFRFGEWHAIGISYGSDGQWIMLDGKVVAASPFLKQKLGRAGIINNLWTRRPSERLARTTGIIIAMREDSMGSWPASGYRSVRRTGLWRLARAGYARGVCDQPFGRKWNNCSRYCAQPKDRRISKSPATRLQNHPYSTNFRRQSRLHHAS